MTAVDRFILLTARTSGGQDWQHDVTDAARLVDDWKAACHVAKQHVVAPLISRSLQRVPCGSVPPFVADLFDAEYQRGKERNRSLFAGLREALEILEGIDVLLMKELGCIDEVYKDRALRPVGDIDLLVRREDVDTVFSKLEGAGFHPKSGRDDFRRKYGTGVQVVHPAKHICLDIQWHQFQTDWGSHTSVLGWDVDSIWRSRVATLMEGRPAWVMSLEDQLLLLCVHGEGHRYVELILLCDLAEFLRNYDQQIDWDGVLRKIHHYRREASAFFSLLLAHALLDAPVPEEVIAEIRPRFFDTTLRRLIFGNLGRLHDFLDSLSTAAAPPEQLMLPLERVVRNQVAFSGMMWSELTAVVRAACAVDGFRAVWSGTPPPRVLPTPDLAATGSLRLLVEPEAQPAIVRALQDQGYDQSDPRRWTATRQVAVNDGPDGGKRYPVAISWSLRTGHLDSEKVGGRGVTKGQTARRAVWRSVLRQCLRQPDPRDVPAQVRIDVLVLPAEEIFHHLSGQTVANSGLVDWPATVQLAWFEQSGRPFPREDLWHEITSGVGARAAWLGDGRYGKQEGLLAEPSRVLFYGVWASLLASRVTQSVPLLCRALARAIGAFARAVITAASGTQSRGGASAHWVDDVVRT